MSQPAGTPWERWLSIGGSVVAPVTAISALLFYFGYVSTREQYLYFGLDVDTIGLTTRDFVMRSGQPLLGPLIVLPLAVAGTVLASRRLRPWLLGHARAGTGIGVGFLVLGVVLVLAYAVAGDWPFYPLLTPAVLAFGGTATAYTLGLGGAPVPARAGLWLTAAAAVFWINATVAQWSGAGLAREQAAHLELLPQVVIDTKERLYLRTPEITESALPPAQGQSFEYRYRGWRLLIQNGDRMFLVPCHMSGSHCVWLPGSPTLLLRLTDATRLQFFAP